MSEAVTAKALSQKERNNYRLTSMEEPGAMSAWLRSCARLPRMPARVRAGLPALRLLRGRLKRNGAIQ